MSNVNVFDPDLHLNPQGSQPIYEQLYTQLTAALRSVNASSGEISLIPERQLAFRLGVDRSLVHRVYSKLLEDGLLRHPEGKRRYFLQLPDSVTHDRKTLGILLSMPYSEYMNTAASRYVRQSYFNGIFDRAAEVGYAIRILQLPAPEEDLAEAERAVRRAGIELDGLIHLGDRGFDRDPVLEKVLALPGLPQIFLGAEYPATGIGSAGYDCAQWIKLFTQYLRELGHRRVALIQPDYWRKYMYCHYDFGDLRDYLDELRSAGVEIDPEWVVLFNDYHMKEKLEDKIRHLIELPKCPTLLLCHSDSTALEVMRILQQLGKRVPEDFSVCGFSDQPEARESTPPLTTFRLPFYDCGRNAVDMLLEYAHNGVQPETRQRRCQVGLITRSSVGRPNPALTVSWH